MKANYLIRHHLSNNDSSMNEVERAQSYVGEAIADGGGSLNWEYKRMLDDVNIEKLKSMTLEEFKSLEVKRMRYNANKVCEEVVMRVDGEPGPGGFMCAYKSQSSSDMFFWDHNYLQMFLDSSKSNDEPTPGSAYYFKLHTFGQTKN